MLDDKPIIILSSTLKRLSRLKGLWLAGWIVASVFGMATTYSLVRMIRYQRTYESLTKEVITLRDSVLSIQIEQKTVTESYIKAWENQQQTADLLVTWGTYVKDQTDIKIQNKKIAPINLVSRKN